MSFVKNALFEALEILEKNDCFFHDGSLAEDSAYKWTDCKYVYASYWEITEHYSTGYKPLDKDLKIFWEIDDSGYRAKALPEMSEMILQLVFRAIISK